MSSQSSPLSSRFRLPAALALGAATLFLVHQGRAGLEGSYVLPADHEAIQYAKRPESNPITRLQAKLNSRGAKLAYHPDFGYLPALLEALEVPVSSQVLVFSKTSFQAPRIGPRTPRALYFNKDVTVGYVRGGDVLELAVHDPQIGVVFYTLDQEPAATPKLRRQDSCLQCHAAGATLGVPGLVVRSVIPDRSGMPLLQLGSHLTDHRSPIAQRWGGWYVTGSAGDAGHMGNQVVPDRDQPPAEFSGRNATALETFFDTGAYLSPHSDIVALMILEHQVRMTNLITRVGWETRMALHSSEAIRQALKEEPGTLSESAQRRIDNASAELVEYLLFAGEASIPGPVEGTSTYAADFAKVGPREPGKSGRSLHDLDLKTRLLRYPCSPLIYSDAFDALPEPAKERVYRGLWDVLHAEPAKGPFAHLTAADRKAILEILSATKSTLPSWWQRQSKSGNQS
jgi:hypothetical protein